jgi:hypothetical protein
MLTIVSRGARHGGASGAGRLSEGDRLMGQLELRTLLVSVRSIAESLPLYEQALGLPLKFQDGDHYAALDGGAITVALATDADHPAPGSVGLTFTNPTESRPTVISWKPACARWIAVTAGRIGIDRHSKTDDVASAVDALVASGARVEMPATDGGHEVRALLRDAAGTAIVVYGPKVE